MSPFFESENKSNGLTRREFFTQTFSWLSRKPLLSEIDEPIPGRIPLSSLKYLPEDVLMRITPVLRCGWTSWVCETGVAYRNECGQEGVVTLEEEGRASARLFDGIRTLDEAAGCLEDELGLAPGCGAPIVRATFLRLAEREVFHPKDPIDAIPTAPVKKG